MSAAGKARLSGGIPEPGNVRAPSDVLYLCSNVRTVSLCERDGTAQRMGMTLEPYSLISIPALLLIRYDNLG